jgi:predicted ATPase
VLETAPGVAARFPDGIVFVELAEVTEADDVPRAIAAALDVREEAERTLTDTLVAALRERRALLIIDNTEHLIGACASLVARLLRAAPELAIACTSREPLRIAGEHVFALEPLPVPNPDDAHLSDAPAVRLFLDRAESAGVRFTAVEDLQRIATICARLDAIPLALELAAARAPLMSPSQIERGLDDRFVLLTRGDRSVAARHQTLMGTLDWSNALLSETERMVLRRVAIWPGNWTLDDAVAVASHDDASRWTAISAVGDLVDRSLIVSVDVRDDERRFRLLHTTQAYALEQAVAAGEYAGIARKQAERMRDLIAHACEAWRGGDDLPFRRIEISSLRAALRWSIGLRNDPRLGAAIAGDAAMAWDFRGAHVEGRQWIDDALAVLDVDDVRPRIRALIGSARLARREHAYGRAADASRRAAELASADGDRRQRAIALLLIGHPAMMIGEADLSRESLREAAALFDEIGDERGSLGAFYELGSVAFRCGDYAEARNRFAELVRRFRAGGNARAATEATIDLAESEYHLGNVREAIARAREALASARELDSTLLIVSAAQNIAGYLIDAGDLAEALPHARLSLELALARGYRVHAGNSVLHVATLLARLGNAYDAALLMGYVRARLQPGAAYHQATEQQEYAALESELAQAFTPAERDALLLEGGELDDDEALAVIRDIAIAD